MHADADATSRHATSHQRAPAAGNTTVTGMPRVTVPRRPSPTLPHSAAEATLTVATAIGRATTSIGQNTVQPATRTTPAGSRRPRDTTLAPFTLAGREVQPTPVFDTYWRFAVERHRVYLARQAGAPAPWTDDPILTRHRFTNPYRASDRVSQYLIRDVVYSACSSPTEVVFRTLLFKFFNKIETWELLASEVGTPQWSSFDIDTYDDVLTAAMNAGQRLYSAAYVMPAPPFGAARKHTNHLRLLAAMMDSTLPEDIANAPSLAHLYEILLAQPSLGPFLAFQYAIDLNYSTVTDFDEMDFVVAGPGARDGLRKCFGDRSAGIEAQLIRWVTDTQDDHLRRLGLSFEGLWGRPLQLIDCQNLFCEVDKYARVAHPEATGHSGRTRIKQRFLPGRPVSPAWFPPKWGINELAAANHRTATDQAGQLE